jgi:AraC-like DNA-binding protein
MEPSALGLQGFDTLDTLVENRTSIGGNDLRFSVYDTYQSAQRVALRSTHPLYCGMITGKKVVHLPDASVEPFEFVPGESLVVPPLETMHIDFPESDETPTRCVTLEVDTDKVGDIVARLNDALPRSPASGPWMYDTLSHCHFSSTPGIEKVLQSILSLFEEDQPHRDAILDLNASELILRMLQTESRALLMGSHQRHASNNGLAAAVQHARKHLDERITVSELAEVACMSESTFYRYFRNEFGMTPLQFLTKERMDRAQEMLRHASNTVTSVGAAVGFSSTSHFINTFKEHVGQTPKQYQLQMEDEAEARSDATAPAHAELPTA